MAIRRPRATGYYATFQGREYHATPSRGNVVLRVYAEDGPAEELTPSRIPGVVGIRTVPRNALDQLVFVKSVCRWQSEPFSIISVSGDELSVFYLGDKGDWMSQQPGMYRTGKLETSGRIKASSTEDMREFVNPLPLA